MDNVKKRIKRKASVLREECVACGTCVKECPMDALRINKGIYAQVDINKCIGCGKCCKVCPASVIEIICYTEGDV